MIVSGVDIIETARIERAIARHGERFFRRFFTEQERRQCDGRIPSLAGRFAVKEAVAKALGTGVGDFSWTDVEVVGNGRGQPQLRLHNKAAELAASQGITTWTISLSHTADYAVGFAVGIVHKLYTDESK
jgi:holo-[acyl-carrier protein] synthase